MSKDVRYGPVAKDGSRAVHWRIKKDNDFSWKHVGWLMPGRD